MRSVNRPSPLFTALLIAGLGLLGACQSAPPNEDATLSDVADDAEAYYGSVVTVSGEVDDVWSPHVFTIGGDDFDDELLVISVDPIAVVPGRTEEEPVAEDDIVQVTGLVEPFVTADLEAEYDLDLDPELEAEFTERPVILAASGATVLASVRVSPRAPVAVATAPVTDLGQVTSPAGQEAHTGELAVFLEAPIQRVVDDNMFWIGPSETERLFVITPEPEAGAPVPAEGAQWTLYGVLRDLPKETVLQTWGLSAETIDVLDDHQAYLHAARIEEGS